MTEELDTRVRHAATRRGHPLVKAIAWLFAGAAGFGLVFVQTYKAQLDAALVTNDITTLLGPDRPAAPQAPTDGSSGLPVNIALIGVDDRSGENGVIGGQEDGMRSDTTLIMHISADRSRIDLVSIPRDTVVQLADCERSDGTSQRGWTDRFNVAFANGVANGSVADGAACTIKTIESLTGIYIDHFAVIDFVGFRDMVAAVDGVPMCIPTAVQDDLSGTSLTAGPQVLNGTQAIAYARMRHGNGLSGSDLDRIDRQQQLLKNLASKVLSAEMLYRPQDVTNFVKAVAGSLRMDDAFGNVDTLTGLAFSLRGLDPSTDFTFATAPVMADPANPKVTVVFTNKASQVWQALIADQPIAPLLDDQSASPSNATSTDLGTTGTGTTGTGTADSGTTTPSDSGIDPNSQEGILAACAAS